MQFELLLTELKSTESLSPYNLSLYRRAKVNGQAQSRFECCSSLVHDPLCREVSRLFFEKDLDAFFREGSHTVCRYGGGFYGFVVPFVLSEQECCVVGDGVRDESIDLWQVAAFSRHSSGEGLPLLPHVEKLPTARFEEVDRVASALAQRVARLCLSAPVAPPPADPIALDLPLAAVAALLERLERAKTIAETVALCCEVIREHFDLAALVLALRQVSGSGYRVVGVWGAPEELGLMSSQALDTFLASEKVKQVPWDDKMRALLPALNASRVATFPLHSRGELLGFMAAIDSELKQTELLLLSMVAYGAASRMAQLLKSEEQSKATLLSGRLMSLANTLLLVDNKEQLYEAVLGIACDLIDATQGSIMLIDKNGDTMHIVFTRGMTLNIARCLPVRVGKGIAGKVAQTGEPLLVNDVETDRRVAMANRARFKSKSLLCVPLKLRDKIIGVLNLSDKKNLAPFNAEDLQLLTSFANLASLMIERSLVLEQSERFEQLSVTDSLTGLYNRRFLKSRLEEELNRSTRQGFNLTVLFIDLDFFKSYNDVCGHIAGDRALRRTAEIIKASLRDMDVVARYGGEEFCAVLPGTSKEEALIVAERIRSEIERERFSGENDIPPRRITASLGVASFPEDGRSYTELVHASDVALYQAKANGRNRIVAAAPAGAQAGAESYCVTSQEAPMPSASARTLDFDAYLEATVIPNADGASWGSDAQRERPAALNVASGTPAGAKALLQ